LAEPSSRGQPPFSAQSSPLAPADPVIRDRLWYATVYQADRMPQLTLRAVLTGGLIGMLMAIAHLYVSIRVGIGFTVTITACVLSYSTWAGLRAASGGRLSQLSILESACMQSTASSAGAATGSAVAITFAALMILDPGHAHQPWWVVALFTLATAMMGVFLAIPVKRQLINDESLPFPSATAAAATLKALYRSGSDAVRAARALLVSMVLAMLVGVLGTAEAQFAALGRFFAWMRQNLFEVHLPEQVPEKGIALVAGKPVLGFGFEPGLMLIGLGMLIGLRVALSILGASALLYFVLVPWLQGLDAQAAGVAGYAPSIPLAGGGKIFHPLRWSLWGGASILLFSSLTTVALEWRMLGRAFSAIGSRRAARAAPAADGAADDVGRALQSIEVPLRWMLLGMIPIAIAMLFLQVVAFGLAWWLGIIAIAMSFLLAMVAARCTAETDMVPTGAMGKLMQLVMALLSPAGAAAPQAMAHNVLGAGIAANSAMGASDLLSDLKTGHLLGANPRRQFTAQAIGVLFGVAAVVPAWYLLVPDYAALEKYPLPAAQIWVAVARALAAGISYLPPSAQMAVLLGGALGVLLPVLERRFPRARPYLPSATGLGLGWVIFFSNALSIAIGAVLAAAWRRISPGPESLLRIPIASGIVAGESLIKALLAMIAVAIGLAS
jgi:putative OPT family oligopeptide transporter